MYRLALVIALLGSGCTVLFPSDFADRAVVTRGRTYEGMAMTGMLQSRSGGLGDTAPEDFDFDWVGEVWPQLPIVHEVSASDNNAAFVLELPFDLPMTTGESAMLEVSVAGTSYGSIEVMGLPEEDLSGTMRVTDLAPLYTRVSLQDVTFEVLDDNTNRPVRIRATREIELRGFVSVDASGTDGGPGGCRGECPGTPVDDLAGAGHATYGDLATDGDGGGGPSYGQESLIDLDSEGGSPGGGTNGGGGGGVIELTSLLLLSTPAAAATSVVSASGGDGGTGSGGGSGGAILVRCREQRGLFGFRVAGGLEHGARGWYRGDAPVRTLGSNIDNIDKPYRGPMFEGLALDPDLPSPRIQAPGTERVDLLVWEQSSLDQGPTFTVVVMTDSGELEATIVDDEAEPRRYVVSFEPIPGEIHQVCLLAAGATEVDTEDLFSERQNCVNIAVP